MDVETPYQHMGETVEPRIQFRCGCCEFDWTPSKTRICRTCCRFICFMVPFVLVCTLAIFMIAHTQHDLNACDDLKSDKHPEQSNRDVFLCIRDDVGWRYASWLCLLFTVVIYAPLHFISKRNGEYKCNCTNWSIICNDELQKCSYRYLCMVAFAICFWVVVFCTVIYVHETGDGYYYAGEYTGIIVGGSTCVVLNIFILLFTCAMFGTK